MKFSKHWIFFKTLKVFSLIEQITASNIKHADKSDLEDKKCRAGVETDVSACLPSLDLWLTTVQFEPVSGWFTEYKSKGYEGLATSSCSEEIITNPSSVLHHCYCHLRVRLYTWRLSVLWQESCLDHWTWENLEPSIYTLSRNQNSSWPRKFSTL